jgi:formylglycine-generating enzyme required for sulfatase activity
VPKVSAIGSPQPEVRNPQSAIRNPQFPGWPFDAAEARRRQAAAGPTERIIDLGDSVSMELMRVPAGEFVLGDPEGCADEWPLTRVRMDKPFWMGRFEVTNEQYRRFDPSHDSRYVSQLNKDQYERGYPLNGPQQPVVRVSWQQAMAFCRWLSQQTGEHFTLPTEAQWEYACRAGTATPFFYGDLDTDFSGFANLADATVKGLVRGDSPDWVPKDPRFNDGALVTAKVGRYQPNAWGLYDLHGNVSEWTRTTYQPYPYADDGRDDGSDPPVPPLSKGGRKVVRGGSWYDRPLRGRSAFRLSYSAWQGVYNVGFRVVCEGQAPKVTARRPE